MKPILAPLALLFLAAFSGCDSTDGVRTAVQRRFSPDYKTHDVDADERAAYEAAKGALMDIGFRQTRGGPSQGFIDALSEVNPSGPNGVARQTSLRVKIGVSTRQPQATEISALFSTVEDSPFRDQQGQATEVPLNESPLYGVYFGYLDKRLAANTAAAKAP